MKSLKCSLIVAMVAGFFFMGCQSSHVRTEYTIPGGLYGKMTENQFILWRNRYMQQKKPKTNSAKIRWYHHHSLKLSTIALGFADKCVYIDTRLKIYRCTAGMNRTRFMRARSLMMLAEVYASNGLYQAKKLPRSQKRDLYRVYILTRNWVQATSCRLTHPDGMHQQQIKNLKTKGHCYSNIYGGPFQSPPW